MPSNGIIIDHTGPDDQISHTTRVDLVEVSQQFYISIKVFYNLRKLLYNNKI